MKSLTLSLLAAIVVAPSLAYAQSADYPTRTVRIVSSFSAGSGPDVMLRLVSQRLSTLWKQPVVVDNKPGGSGFIAVAETKRGQSDGYTLLHVDGLNFTAIPHMYKTLPYDPVKDFAPVTPLHYSNFFVAVSSKSKWNSVGDLLADAKGRPDRVTYGSWQVGSVAHLGGASLDLAAGTKMTHVPFKDNGQLYAAVAAGEVDWAFGSAASAGPLQQAGRLKFLALAGKEPLPTHPNVPVMGGSGGPAGFELAGWVGMFSPAGTPQAVIDKINGDIASIFAQAEMQPRLRDMGYFALPIKPDAMAERIKRESASYAKTIKEIRLALD